MTLIDWGGGSSCLFLRRCSPVDRVFNIFSSFLRDGGVCSVNSRPNQGGGIGGGGWGSRGGGNTRSTEQAGKEYYLPHYHTCFFWPYTSLPT